MNSMELLDLIANIDNMLAQAEVYDPSGYNAEWKVSIIDSILNKSRTPNQIDDDLKALHQNLIDQGNGRFDGLDYTENL